MLLILLYQYLMLYVTWLGIRQLGPEFSGDAFEFGNVSCVAWRFLAIAMAIRDAFARETVALEVGFHSNLTSVLQHAHITLNVNVTIVFQCEKTFTRMCMIIGCGVHSSKVGKQQINKFHYARLIR